MDSSSSFPRKPEPGDQAIPDDLRRLEDAVRNLPEEYRAVLQPYLETVITRSKRRQNTMSLLQEAFAQLRLDMKYLIFDLEATMQERDMYRAN